MLCRMTGCEMSSVAPQEVVVVGLALHFCMHVEPGFLFKVSDTESSYNALGDVDEPVRSAEKDMMLEILSAECLHLLTWLLVLREGEREPGGG